MADRIVRYSPVPNATPEAERDALVAVYRFLIERHTDRKTADFGDAEETEGGGDVDREPDVPMG